MYLSKLILNPRVQSARYDLADCQAMHRRLLSAFGETEAEAVRATFGLLYRVENDARIGITLIIVQSKERPDWNRLPTQYLRETGEANPACKFVGDKYAALPAETPLRFRLRANPTRKIDTKTLADGKRRNGRRVELRDKSAQLAWLERRAAQHGFRLQAVQAIDENKSIGKQAASSDYKVLSSSRGETGGKPLRPPRLTFASVLFEGELIVTEKELFHAALKQGIGTGKAYGFGLLSIATPRQK